MPAPRSKLTAIGCSFLVLSMGTVALADAPPASEPSDESLDSPPPPTPPPPAPPPTVAAPPVDVNPAWTRSWSNPTMEKERTEQTLERRRRSGRGLWVAGLLVALAGTALPIAGGALLVAVNPWCPDNGCPNPDTGAVVLGTLGGYAAILVGMIAFPAGIILAAVGGAQERGNRKRLDRFRRGGAISLAPQIGPGQAGLRVALTF